MKKQLYIFLLLIPALCLAQKKYKHQYRICLKPQESTYTLIPSDSNATGKRSIRFFIADNKKEELPFVNIKIKDGKKNVVLLSDIYGQAHYEPLTDTISISFFDPNFTPIEIKQLLTGQYPKIDIHTSLGASNAFRIAIIYSKRKLTKEEIDQINNDLSFNNGDNELIKNKTCLISWEI